MQCEMIQLLTAVRKKPDSCILFMSFSPRCCMLPKCSMHMQRTGRGGHIQLCGNSKSYRCLVRVVFLCRRGVEKSAGRQISCRRIRRLLSWCRVFGLFRRIRYIRCDRPCRLLHKGPMAPQFLGIGSAGIGSLMDPWKTVQRRCAPKPPL